MMPVVNHLERMIGALLRAGKPLVLTTSGILVVVAAVADRYIGTDVSLGVLYILPMMLSAVVLAPLESAAMAILCSSLRSWFDDVPGPGPEMILRFIFAFVAYGCSALFVIAIVRNRELVVEHLIKIQREQALRKEAEEQVRVLVESSPAAILTVDGTGVVLAANHAANALFMIEDRQTLHGRPIGNYLPVLTDALRLNDGLEGFRTAAQCQGRRENGEIFLAHTWFSSYVAPEGVRLAAIVVDSSEEMRDREEEGLRHFMRGNRMAAAAVSHDVRNLCGAISLISSNLKQKLGLDHDEDFLGLANLVNGLEKIALLELHTRVHEALEAVELQRVLDSLRIVIESDWQDVDGTLRWRLPAEMPAVLADPHGLLQAFLNLAQNSLRAVQESPVRELKIGVEIREQKAFVRFQDSGPGVAAPERLFEPFQPGANGSGVGLYVSRAVVRSYGGEVRFEPQPAGSCFVVELSVVT
jgi:two-component system sensor kinase FixL